MNTTIRYVLLTALRDKLFAGLLVGIVLASLVSTILGGTAVVEKNEMMVAYAAASARIILAVGLIVFVCFHIRGAFDTREMDVFLSRPISRPRLVLSYFLGFALVALMLVIPTAGIVGAAGHFSSPGLAGWTASLLLEAMMVIAVSLFSAFTLSSAVSSVLASMGFYVLSRMMGFFVATTDSAFLFRDPMINEVLKNTLKAISALIPRLDFFAKTEWLVYGFKGTQEVQLFLIQALAFIPLLIAAATIDFLRREF